MGTFLFYFFGDPAEDIEGASIKWQCGTQHYQKFSNI